jgi:hypothetical protein
MSALEPRLDRASTAFLLPQNSENHQKKLGKLTLHFLKAERRTMNRNRPSAALRATGKEVRTARNAGGIPTNTPQARRPLRELIFTQE